MATMRDSGQFRMIAGRIRDFVETEAALEVHYIPRGRSTDEAETAAAVERLNKEPDQRIRVYQNIPATSSRSVNVFLTGSSRA